MSQGFSSILNFSRWFAALLVVISHVRALLFSDAHKVVEQSMTTKVFYFVTGFGHQAVVIFFVVSGLLVGALSLEKWQTGKASGLTEYFIHRFSRIYIVLIPALFIGFSIDYIGSSYFDGAQLYSNNAQYHFNSFKGVVKNSIGINILLGNMVMLQNILVGCLGSNGPLWSLAYEWWYYCIWAFAIGSFFYRGIKRYVSILLLILLTLSLPTKIIIWFIIWIIGIITFYYCRTNLPKPHPFLGLTIFITAMSISRILDIDRSNLYMDFSRDLFVGISFAIALISFSKLDRPILLNVLHIKLASFSYSLYLVHFPMMIFMAATFQEFLKFELLKLQPSSISYLLFFIFIFLLYSYAYLFSLMTEKHTFTIINIFKRVIGRNRLASQ